MSLGYHLSNLRMQWHNLNPPRQRRPRMRALKVLALKIHRFWVDYRVEELEQSVDSALNDLRAFAPELARQTEKQIEVRQRLRALDA